MALIKREYTDEETLITAKNLNEIQDAIIELEDGLFAVEGNGSGETITMTDAANRGFKSFNIYGKTTQDGTPTPDNSVELVSVGGNGSITVNVTGEKESKSMTLATPNGLPGIPVTEDGNYADANGQQWICDEIDLARGVYVQRCGEIVMDGTADVTVGQHGNLQYFCKQPVLGIARLDAGAPKMVLCDRYEASGWTDQNNKAYCVGTAIVITDNRFTDMAATLAILMAEKPRIIYVLESPIETPLPEEEIAAYNALRTYRNHTTVTNDASAYMELEYAMDAKKYIDSMITGSMVPATVE